MRKCESFVTEIVSADLQSELEDWSVRRIGHDLMTRRRDFDRTGAAGYPLASKDGEAPRLIEFFDQHALDLERQMIVD